MATSKREKLEGLNVSTLKRLASENDVTVPQPGNKPELVEAIASSNLNTEEIPEASDDASDDAAPSAPVVDLGHQGLLSDDEGVVVDRASGSLSRVNPDPDVMMSESAKKLSQSEPHTEEYGQIINTTTWVRLGNLKGDLARFSGHEAAVISAPQRVVDDPDFTSTGPKLVQDPDTVFTVRTRDQDSALLQVTVDDFAEISYDGRFGLTSAG